MIRDAREERDTWYAFGLARLQAGEIDEAVRCFDRALELDPAFAEAARMRGEVLLEPDAGYEAPRKKEEKPASRPRSR